MGDRRALGVHNRTAMWSARKMAGKQKQSVMGIENFVRGVHIVRHRREYEMLSRNPYLNLMFGGPYHFDFVHTHVITIVRSLKHPWSRGRYTPRFVSTLDHSIPCRKTVAREKIMFYGEDFSCSKFLVI